MFYLTMVDYHNFLHLTDHLDFVHHLDTQGYSVNHVGPHNPLKFMGWLKSSQVGCMVVAHKIVSTSPEAKFPSPSPFVGLTFRTFGLDFGLGLGLGLVNSSKTNLRRKPTE